MYHKPGGLKGYHELDLYFLTAEDRQCWIDDHVIGGKFDWSTHETTNEPDCERDFDDEFYGTFVVTLKLV
jgi:hypothetical protein